MSSLGGVRLLSGIAQHNNGLLLKSTPNNQQLECFPANYYDTFLFKYTVYMVIL